MAGRITGLVICIAQWSAPKANRILRWAFAITVQNFLLHRKLPSNKIENYLHVRNLSFPFKKFGLGTAIFKIMFSSSDSFLATTVAYRLLDPRNMEDEKRGGCEGIWFAWISSFHETTWEGQSLAWRFKDVKVPPSVRYKSEIWTSQVSWSAPCASKLGEQLGKNCLELTAKRTSSLKSDSISRSDKYCQQLRILLQKGPEFFPAYHPVAIHIQFFKHPLHLQIEHKNSNIRHLGNSPLLPIYPTLNPSGENTTRPNW